MITNLSEENEILTQQETNTFTLEVDGEATVTSYFDFQSAGYNQFTVKTDYSDNRGYVSFQQVECK